MKPMSAVDFHAKHVELGKYEMADAYARYYLAEVAEGLAEALEDLLASTSCEHYHHKAYEYHPNDYVCPVRKRYDAALADFTKAVKK